MRCYLVRRGGCAGGGGSSFFLPAYFPLLNLSAMVERNQPRRGMAIEPLKASTLRVLSTLSPVHRRSGESRKAVELTTMSKRTLNYQHVRSDQKRLDRLNTAESIMARKDRE